MNAGKNGVDYSKMKPEGCKGAIINQSWTGLAATPLAFSMPTVVVGDEMYNMFAEDPTNKPFPNCPNVSKTNTLEEAVEEISKLSGTDKFQIYDGSYGFINCTRSMAEELIELAPKIKEEVDALYPMYMEQRGVEIPDYMK